MDNFITSQALPSLVKNGLLPRGLYVRALSVFRNAKAWDGWALRSLLALGAGHVLAGVIFFFAYNWHDLSATIKFGLVLGGMVVSALAWIGLKLDKPVAQMFGICLTVLVGVFMAVFGQVFQTPSALYTPFTMWAILSLPFAFVSRSLAHWAVWIVVASVAANSYIVLGLSHTYGNKVLVMAFASVAAVFFALLVVYDRVQNIWPQWARAGWFRVLLVATNLVFANIAMTMAIFKNNVDWVWPLIFALAAGVVFYLYRLRSSKFTHNPPARIASLVLAASGLGAMAAQVGLRGIGELVGGNGDSIVLALLLSFLWIAGITFVLAKAFKHFSVKFKGENERDETNLKNADMINGEFNPSKREDIASFADTLEIEAETTRNVLLAVEDDTPWYMEMFLGIAGVFAAVLAMSFLGTFLAITMDMENPESFLIAGLVVYAGAMAIRLNTSGMFARHFFNTVLLGGGALAVFGAGWLFEGELPFIIFTLILSTVTVWLVRDRILEFLMAAGFSGVLAYALEHYHIPYGLTALYAFSTVLGIFLLVHPIRTGIGKLSSPRVLSAAAAAFLLAPCFYGFFIGWWGSAVNMVTGVQSMETPISWVQQGVCVAITGAAIWYLNTFRNEGDPFRPPLLILALLLVAILLMPLGSAAALLLILAGYILGLRSLTIVGVLAQIAYMVWYYYDLDISLLNKSLLLMGFGAILLLVYWIALKKGEQYV